MIWLIFWNQLDLYPKAWSLTPSEPMPRPQLWLDQESAQNYLFWIKGSRHISGLQIFWREEPVPHKHGIKHVWEMCFDIAFRYHSTAFKTKEKNLMFQDNSTSTFCNIPTGVSLDAQIVHVYEQFKHRLSRLSSHLTLTLSTNHVNEKNLTWLALGPPNCIKFVLLHCDYC